MVAVTYVFVMFYFIIFCIHSCGEYILKWMMDQKFSAVMTFVQLMLTDIKNEMKDLRQENIGA